MRSVAIERKNYLFVGSQTGGRAAAISDILIETAKLNASFLFNPPVRQYQHKVGKILCKII